MSKWLDTEIQVTRLNFNGDNRDYGPTMDQLTSLNSLIGQGLTDHRRALRIEILREWTGIEKLQSTKNLTLGMVSQMIDYLKVEETNKWELHNNGKRFLTELEQRCIDRLPPPKKRAKRAGKAVSKAEKAEWEQELEEIDNELLRGPGIKSGFSLEEINERHGWPESITAPEVQEQAKEAAEILRGARIDPGFTGFEEEEEGLQPDGRDDDVPWGELNEEGVTETEYIHAGRSSRRAPESDNLGDDRRNIVILTGDTHINSDDGKVTVIQDLGDAVVHLDTGDQEPAEVPPDDGEGESDEERVARIVRNMRATLDGNRPA